MSARRKVSGDFTREFAEALRRRAKAITYRGAKIECIPVKEIVDGKESDIRRVDLKLSYRVVRVPVKLQLHVWDDRWVWVDVRQSSRIGWAWEYTAEGRFLSSNGARDLIGRLEKTIDATWAAHKDAKKSVDEIWSKCLATGPRATSPTFE